MTPEDQARLMAEHNRTRREARRRGDTGGWFRIGPAEYRPDESPDEPWLIEFRPIRWRWLDPRYLRARWRLARRPR